MAGVCRNSKMFSHDIVFDGALMSNTRASLVIELIKYFLYERQQIPLPLDQMKSHICDLGKKSNGRQIVPPTTSATSTMSMATASSNTDADNHQSDIAVNCMEPNNSNESSNFQQQRMIKTVCDKYLDEETSFPEKTVGVGANQYLPQPPAPANGKAMDKVTVTLDQNKVDETQESNKKSTDFTHKFSMNVSLEGRLKQHIKSQNGVIHGKTEKAKALTNGMIRTNPTEWKVKNLINDLTQIFEHLEKAFVLCPEIEQVIVLFGGTIFSPKESYLINFPPPCPDADCLPLAACQRTLFKHIIGEDILGMLSSSVSPTNMTLLLSAPRSCPLNWFVPKQSFTSPRTGSIVTFNFQCTYLVPICCDLSFVEGDMELSGIEPLDCSLCEAVDNKGVAEVSCEHGEAVSETGASNVCETDINLHCKEQCLEVAASAGSNIHDMQVSINASSQLADLPRFCAHQKVNYIYSHRKQKRVVSSNTPEPMMSCTQAQQTITNNNETVSSESVGRDFIWYQSPLVIKGCKAHQLTSGTENCMPFM